MRDKLCVYLYIYKYIFRALHQANKLFALNAVWNKIVIKCVFIQYFVSCISWVLNARYRLLNVIDPERKF
jgi:hypothetical protein